MLGESPQGRAPGPGWFAVSPDGAASLQALVTIDKPCEDRLTRSVLLQQRRYSVQSEVIISVPQQEPTASISLNISANVIDRLHFRMIRTCTMMAGLLRGMDYFFSGFPWIIAPTYSGHEPALLGAQPVRLDLEFTARNRRYATCPAAIPPVFMATGTAPSGVYWDQN